MTDEMKALAQRAVACKHWRWMPGMLVEVVSFSVAGGCDVLPMDVRLAEMGEPTFDRRRGVADTSLVGHPCLPDLSDPATLGCLLHLVREAWESPDATSDYSDGRWSLRIWNSDNFANDFPLGELFPTEAEALVAALEAADE